MTEGEASSIDEVRKMLRELTITTSMLHAQADRALSAKGQNLSRWQALHQYAAAPTAVPAVARSLNQSRQYVQRITDDMTRDGLVEASPNPGHRRSPLFSATPRGIATLDELEDGVAEWTGFLASALTPDELAPFRAALEHLRRVVVEYTTSGERPIDT
jgi:DNA-binding MarR family transcriptional regulator